MLVIETNISYNNLDEFCDHQSRIIEVESWESYVASYVNEKPERYYGTMTGFNFFSNYTLYGLKYDDFHLRCKFTNGTQKLAYKVPDEFKLVHEMEN